MDFKHQHEFFDFMKSMQDWLAQEYTRIQKHTIADPGTAGDQAEENWAMLLRNWLPANYPVVTKGRIIASNGDTSPQVDILVLHPSYPLALRDKKLYFAGGVVAAFECKLTLRTSHLKKAFRNAIATKALLHRREGNPYDELHQPIIFGLLAHSHDWRASEDKAIWRISESVYSQHADLIHFLEKESSQLCHPCYLPDVICVANAGTLVLRKTIKIGPIVDPEMEEPITDDSIEEVDTSYHEQFTRSTKITDTPGVVLGSLISSLMIRLAFEDASLRPFAQYLESTTPWASIGQVISWPPKIFSKHVLSQLSKGKYDDSVWSKWHRMY